MNWIMFVVFAVFAAAASIGGTATIILIVPRRPVLGWVLFMLSVGVAAIAGTFAVAMMCLIALDAR